MTPGALTDSTFAGMFDIDGIGTDHDAQDRNLKASSAVVAALAGWNGADYVDTTAGVTNHAVVYSNPGAPKSELFSEKHKGKIADDSGQVPQSMFASLKVTGTGFRTSPGTKTHALPSGSTADHISVRGTLDGASGSFRCPAAQTCQSSGDSGVGTSLTSNWFFIADDGAMTSTPDGEYVMYGWWARDAGNTVAVATFADDAGGPLEPSDISGLSSKATYIGGAAGKVAVYSPVSDDNVAGAFTASAELTADFGTGGDSGTNGTIEGTISGFSVDGAMQDWSVALKSQMINGTGGFDNGTNGTTEWTIDGDKGDGTGTYDVQLYEAGESGLPLTAAGTFTGVYGSVGNMVGAFGAETTE